MKVGSQFRVIEIYETGPEYGLYKIETPSEQSDKVKMSYKGRVKIRGNAYKELQAAPPEAWFVIKDMAVYTTVACGHFTISVNIEDLEVATEKIHRRDYDRSLGKASGVPF